MWTLMSKLKDNLFITNRARDSGEISSLQRTIIENILFSSELIAMNLNN